MTAIKKFSLDENETYFGLIKITYKNDDTGIVKAKGFFAYKRGLLKDQIVEGPKTYEFPLENMKHWKEIK
jgi:hypothetical protein